MYGVRFGMMLDLIIQANAGGHEQPFSTKTGRVVPETITLSFTNHEQGTYNLLNHSISKSEVLLSCIEFCSSGDKKALPLPFPKSSLDMIKNIIEGRCVNSLKSENISLNTIIAVHDMIVEDYLGYDDEIRTRVGKTWWDWLLPIYILRKYIANEEEEETRVVFNAKLFRYISRCRLEVIITKGTVTFCRNYYGQEMNLIDRNIEITKVKIRPEVMNLKDADTSICISKCGMLGLINWFVSYRYSNISQFELDLSDCVIDKDILRYLGTIRGLRKLNLNGCIIDEVEGESDETMDREELVGLEECDISGVKISEEIISILARSTNLRKLAMEQCFVNSKVSFEFIRKLSNLKELNICGNILSNEQLDVIFEHEGITVLCMERCAVDKEYAFGSYKSSVSLKSAGFIRNVVEFSFGRTYFGDTQMEMILTRGRFIKLSMRQCGLEAYMVMKMKGGDCLLDLDLSENSMLSDKILLHIGNECRKLERLNINGCNMVIDTKKDNCLMFKELKSLYIANNKLEKVTCGCIFKFSLLKSLDMTGCGLVEGHLNGIEKLNELTELHIGENFVGKEDIINVFKLKELKVLDLRSLRLLDEKYANKSGISFKGIEQLSSLKILVLTNNILNDACIQEIFELCQLEDLRMGWISKGIPTCHIKLENISKLINLKRLTLADICLEKHDFNAITKLNRLTGLHIRNCTLSDSNILKHVGRLSTTLKVLELKCEKTTVDNLEPLTELKNLQELKLKNIRGISTDGMIAIMKELRGLRTFCSTWLTIDAEKLAECSESILEFFITLDTLKLGLSGKVDGFIKNILSRLVNLKEFRLSADAGTDVDVSGFPMYLRKIRLGGAIYEPSSGPLNILYSDKCKDSRNRLENAEDLNFSMAAAASENLMSSIASCFKLRILKMSLGRFNAVPRYIIEDLEKLVTLETLFIFIPMQNQPLSVQFSVFTGLRKLRCVCYGFVITDSVVSEIGKLDCLEHLKLSHSGINTMMNEILWLKNLRELEIDGDVWFSYEEGSFAQIKGIKKLYCVNWNTFVNNEIININHKDYNYVVNQMGNECTLDSWKGVTNLGVHTLEPTSSLCRAVSSSLVFLKHCMLGLEESPTNLDEAYTRRIQPLINCVMLERIQFNMPLGHKDEILEPVITAIITNKPLLQKCDAHINSIGKKLASELSASKYLHSIIFRIKRHEVNDIKKLLAESMLEMRFLNEIKLLFMTNYCITEDERTIIEKAKTRGIQTNISFDWFYEQG